MRANYSQLLNEDAATRRQNQQTQLSERAVQKKLTEAERRYTGRDCMDFWALLIPARLFCVKRKVTDLATIVGACRLQYCYSLRENRTRYDRLKETTARNREKYELATAEVRSEFVCDWSIGMHLILAAFTQSSSLLWGRSLN